MGDGTNLQALQEEIDAVAKQMQKVEANCKAVESAIVVEGTFRGYRGEDLFLKHNLGPVQEEMMKQLVRKQKGLNIRRRELLGHCGSGSPTAVGATSGGVPCAPEVTPATGNCNGAGNSGQQGNRGDAGDSSSKPSSVSTDGPRNSSCDESNKGNGVEASNNGGGANRDSSSKGGGASGITPEARKLSPPKEQRSPPSIPRPTASTPNRSDRLPSPMEISSPATTVRSSSTTLSVDAMSPDPETPLKDSAPLGLVTTSGGASVCGNAATATTKTIPHKESKPQSTADPRRELAYTRPVIVASPVRGKRILMPPAPADRAAGGAAGNTGGISSRGGGSSKPKKTRRRDSSSVVAPRPFKSSRRGQSDTPGPAHSVEEYLANTQRGRDAVASISEGTVFWIKFSDTKESWLECGVVKKVHHKSAVPYEVEWRPYDSTGCDIALNPKKRISLTPRLFVGKPEDFDPATEGDPPAGTAPRGEFRATTKKQVLTVPPIGSWCIVKVDQPWGSLGPFAF